MEVRRIRRGNVPDVICSSEQIHRISVLLMLVLVSNAWIIIE